jgi:hypothetical protein
VTRSIPALVLAACLLTAACAAGATATPPAGSAAPAASPAAATPAEASALASTAVTTPPAAVGGDGAALCAFLQSELPALKAAGSTGGAVAQLAIDYANWIAADSSRVLPDAAAMDTLTQASCPGVRTDVLKTIGSDSFANGL